MVTSCNLSLTFSPSVASACYTKPKPESALLPTSRIYQLTLSTPAPTDLGANFFRSLGASTLRAYTLASSSLTSAFKMVLTGREGFSTDGLPMPMRSQIPSFRAASMPKRVRKPPVTMSGMSGSLALISRANSRKKDSRAAVFSDLATSSVPIIICDMCQLQTRLF